MPPHRINAPGTVRQVTNTEPPDEAARAANRRPHIVQAYHAIQKRWPISEQQRADCIARLSEVVAAGSDASSAEIVTAAEGLLRAWRQNAEADRQAEELGGHSKRAAIRLPRRSDPLP